MQSIYLIETYVYATKNNLVSEKEEINSNNIIKNIQKMINFDDVTKENIKEYDQNWPKTSDHSYKILIIGGSGSGKTNSLLSLISHQSDIDKNAYAKDPYEAKY